MYVKILSNGGADSIKDIKFPVVVQAKSDPFGCFVDYTQFENLPGFRQDLLTRDLGVDETEFLFWSDEFERFKD